MSDTKRELLNADELVKTGKKIMIVKIGVTKDDLHPERSLDFAKINIPKSPALMLRTKGTWKVAKSKADKIEYIIGVENGKGRIVSLVKVTGNHIVVDERGADRYEFEGEPADDIEGIDVLQKLLVNYKLVDAEGKMVKGAASAVVYLNL